MNRTLPAIAAGAMLLLAACGGTAAPASAPPGSAPAAPASAAAKPSSPAPAASISAKPSAAASAAAAASLAASGGAKPAIKFSNSSTPAFSYIPLLMAQDALRSMGYKVDNVTFNESEVSVEAVNKNEAQLGSGSTYTVMQAIQKGGKMKLIGDRNSNEWAIAAINAITDCNTLNGKRLAIHSEGAVSTAMVNAWLQDKCPQAKPNILVIPGSDKRAAAILANQIDATPIELADWIDLQKKAPGRFHLLADLAHDLPKLDSSAMYVNNDFLAKNRPALVDFVTELIKADRAVLANPDLLKQANKKYNLGNDDSIDEIIKGYLSINGFDKNGGFDADKMAYSIDFFTKANQLKPGVKVEDVADVSIINEVLAKLGKQ